MLTSQHQIAGPGFENGDAALRVLQSKSRLVLSVSMKPWRICTAGEAGCWMPSRACWIEESRWLITGRASTMSSNASSCVCRHGSGDRLRSADASGAELWGYTAGNTKRRAYYTTENMLDAAQKKAEILIGEHGARRRHFQIPALQFDAAR